MSKQIIYDVDELRKFYRYLVQPLDIEGDRGLLLFLTSRKKYYPDFMKNYIKSDNFLNKYFFKYNDEDIFITSVKKLNLDLESYLIKMKITPEEFMKLPPNIQNQIAEYVGKFYIFSDYYKKGEEKRMIIHFHPPVDTITLYIDLNPKSAMSGTIKAVKQVLKQVEDMSVLNSQVSELIMNGVSPDSPEVKRKIEEIKLIQKWFKNFKTSWLSEIHRSNAGHPPYFQIDVDVKDEELLEKITRKVNPVEAIIETKNGYHIIYKNERKLKAVAHKEFGVFKPDVEIQSEVMTPLPGTLQGGFKVKMIYP